MRRIFEIENDETFWMVARNEEDAINSLRVSYSEELEEGYTVKEVSEETHFIIEVEDTGIRYDVWDMVKIDEQDDIKMPYMIASTLY